MILSTVRWHSLKMQQARCQATEVSSGLACQTSSETTLDEENHEWIKKKTGPRKSHLSGKMGDRLSFNQIQRQEFVLSVPGNQISHEGFQHESALQHYAQRQIRQVHWTSEEKSTFFTKATTTQKSSLMASYSVSLELAKAKKPLSDWEKVKWCVVEMAKAFRDDNMAEKFESLCPITPWRKGFSIFKIIWKES